MATPLVPSDLLRFVLVSDPQITPDGSAVYYRRSWFDEEADEIRGAIQRVARDGADRAFTSGTNDRLPRVAPDGSAVAFVADRDGKTRAVRAAARRRRSGRRARRLQAKITAVAWSPDAQRVAFVATAPYDAAERARLSTTRRAARGTSACCRSRATPTGCIDGVRNHLFVVGRRAASPRRDRSRHGDFDVSGRRRGRPTASASRSARGLDLSGRRDGVVDGAERHLRRRRRRAARRCASRSRQRSAMRAGVLARRPRDRFHRSPARRRRRRPLRLRAACRSGRRRRDRVRSLRDSAARRATCWPATCAAALSSPPAWSDGRPRDHRAGQRRGQRRRCARSRATERNARRAPAANGTIFGFTVAGDGTIAIAYRTPTVPNEIARRSSRTAASAMLTRRNPWLGDEERRRAANATVRAPTTARCSTRG